MNSEKLMKLLKRILLEVLGWSLVIAGIAALILPGPGLVLLALGLYVLSQQYEWAERRLDPVKQRAMKGAADGVKTWPRIALSTLGCLMIIGNGVLWILSPPAPGWWPLDEKYWLLGGSGTGVSLILSGLIAFALLVWSLKRFRWTYEDSLTAEG